MQISILLVLVSASAVISTTNQFGSDLPASCTLALIRKCATFTPPICPATVLPALNLTSCCPTCRLSGKHSCDDLPVLDPCSHVPTCLSALATPVFDLTSCCPSCNRPPAVSNGGTPVQGTCTSQQFRQCVQNSPTCATGQPSQIVSNLCCPSCIPPVLSCGLVDRLVCRAVTRHCAAGEVPMDVAGSCCPSCIPPPPVCACPAPKVCAYDANFTTTCRYFRHPEIRLYIHEVEQLVNATAGTFEDICPHVPDLLRDIIDRFCLKVQNAAICLRDDVQNTLKGLLLTNCTYIGGDNSSLAVELAIPHTIPGSRRRDDTATSSTTQSVVNGAISDPDATSGISIQAADTAPPSGGSSGGSDTTTYAIIGGVVGGVALVAVIALFAIRARKSRRTGSVDSGTHTPIHNSLTRNPVAVTAY